MKTSNVVAGPVQTRKAARRLAIIFEDFAQFQRQLGYCPRVIELSIRVAGHFTAWLELCRLTLHETNQDCIRRFLEEHLPHCQCQQPVPRGLKNCRAGLNRLFGFLMSRGLCAAAKPRCLSLTDRLLDSYERHMTEIRGLSPATRLYRQRYAREFLDWLSRQGRLQLSGLSVQQIPRYVAWRAKSIKSASARVMATSLRSFLRFLEFEESCRPGLVNAVPRVANWGRTSPPKTLKPKERQRLMASFDRLTPTGRRDYAIVLCMLELGLRASEVAELQLRDFDWEEGRVLIRGGKQCRDRLLPLPERVGQALAHYLKNGRPKSTAQHVFLCHHLPVGSPITVLRLRSAIRRAYSRCRINAGGTHLLRHTFATRLHQRGVGLKAVADLLGDRDLNTASQYTRVNLKQLRTAALPWPKRRA
jgi:integrase/recombinase XerD